MAKCALTPQTWAWASQAGTRSCGKEVTAKQLAVPVADGGGSGLGNDDDQSRMNASQHGAEIIRVGI